MLVTLRSCLQHPPDVQVPRVVTHTFTSFKFDAAYPLLLDILLFFIYHLKRLRACSRRLRPWTSAFRVRQGHFPEFGGSKLPAVLAEGRTRCPLCRPGR